MTTAIPNYGWFLSQVVCFAYVPIFGAVVTAAYFRGDISDVGSSILHGTTHEGQFDFNLCIRSGNEKISKT